MYDVIIIEDDPMVASINKQYIEKNNQLRLVMHASNGKEALDYLEEHSVDLAILDVYMPMMDGIELLHEIRKKQHRLDVIMVTAASDAEHVKELFSLGILDYLVKPFEYARFQQALEKFLDRKRILELESLSQEHLDLLTKHSIPVVSKKEPLAKGLQPKTLETIVSYMEQHPDETFTSEEIANNVGLSRVTVRRYMNYLLEEEKITSDIDYTTGGRPKILYQRKKNL